MWDTVAPDQASSSRDTCDQFHKLATDPAHHETSHEAAIDSAKRKFRDVERTWLAIASTFVSGTRPSSLPLATVSSSPKLVPSAGGFDSGSSEVITSGFTGRRGQRKSSENCCSGSTKKAGVGQARYLSVDWKFALLRCRAEVRPCSRHRKKLTEGERKSTNRSIRVSTSQVHEMSVTHRHSVH